MNIFSLYKIIAIVLSVRLSFPEAARLKALDGAVQSNYKLRLFYIRTLYVTSAIVL